MADTLKLRIVTPRGVVYDREVAMVTLPAQDGELGVYPTHTPLFTLIGQGEVIAKATGKEDRILVTGGCAEITGDAVSILTVFATDEERVDERQAEEARRRAEERLKERDKLSPEELALVQASLAHSTAQLRVRRRRRPGQPPGGGSQG
ncbi:MAG: ATP synthase F1 subunit epsilon [Verrucomicrobia bacterium]|nr:ATP synthase F1 subunit epsilon [Verrucomicrobiota bacterium]